MKDDTKCLVFSFTSTDKLLMKMNTVPESTGDPFIKWPYVDTAGCLMYVGLVERNWPVDNPIPLNRLLKSFVSIHGTENVACRLRANPTPTIFLGLL